MLISKQYLKLNRRLHKSPRGFGASGHRWSDIIMDRMVRNKWTSLLDYGCGRETLWAGARRHWYGKNVVYCGYDPAVDGRQRRPSGVFDLVACTDVMEHVEPKYLDAVIVDIFSFAKFAVFLNIALKPANKRLPDGRNTHLIIKSREWWMCKLCSIVGNGWTLGEKENGKWKEVTIWATAAK